MRVVLIIAVLAVMLAGCTADIGTECLKDADCVPAACCHANECVTQENAPNCSDILCTMECISGTLDCGQGECICKNGICSAEFLK